MLKIAINTGFAILEFVDSINSEIMLQNFVDIFGVSF